MSKRNYSQEYADFHSSKEAIQKRSELNSYNEKIKAKETPLMIPVAG